MLLVMATLISCGLELTATGRWAGPIVLLVAFVKARVVLRVFMELANSPLVLQRLGELWVLLAGTVVISTYFLAPLLVSPA